MRFSGSFSGRVEGAISIGSRDCCGEHQITSNPRCDGIEDNEEVDKDINPSAKNWCTHLGGNTDKRSSDEIPENHGIDSCGFIDSG